MTVQPTHQSADGRKFVKVADLPMKTVSGHMVAWQSVYDGHCHVGHEGSIVDDSGCVRVETPLTPIPQPEVRWIGVNTSSNMASNYMASKGEAVSWFARGGYDHANFFIRVSTLNGVRTASVEQA